MAIKITKSELPLLLGIVALLLVLLLIYKQLGTFNQARLELQTEQEALLQASQNLQALTQVRDQAAHFEEQLLFLEEVMPKKPREDLLIKSVQTMAIESGMELKQIKFETYEARQEHIEIPIKLSLEGQYHGLLNFLESIQNGPRAIRIEEVRIGKGWEISSATVELTAKAFYLK